MDNILIIGGTGTLGNAFVRKTINKYNITVLSRNEHRQQEMKREFPNITYVIGDIRDKESIKRAFFRKRYVFHFAALKHIDVCEENVFESVKTNILGTQNVVDLCMDFCVERCIFSSTDKAVDPISVYGYSKAISEKILMSYNVLRKTNFVVYRWPNVTASNGSFIKVILDKLSNKEVIPITDIRMSRFFIKIEDAVDYVLNTFEDAFYFNKVLIPNHYKSALIIDVVKAISSLMNVHEYEIKQIGLRGVEKLSECLSSSHNPLGSIDSNDINTRFSMEQLKLFLSPIVMEYLGSIKK